MRLPQFLINIQIKLSKMFDKSTDHGEKSEMRNAPSIQEIAIKLAEEQQRLRNLEAPTEHTLFVLGSKGVGKSTVINKFFDREEHSTRPTLALEYSYGRRRLASGNTSRVLNVWELGSLENAEQLLEVPMRTHGLLQLAAFIMIDLSQPQRVWTDLECAYKGLRETANRMLEQATPQVRETLEQSSMERVKRGVGGEQRDQSTLELLPFPVVIVGGKYDVFMNFEPALKKHICRCLRSMAHLIGGAVLFYSAQLPKLAMVLRDTISHLGFDSPAGNPFRGHITDYNDALSIWFGTDSWARISDGAGALSVDRIGALLGVEVPQLQLEKQVTQQLHDPAKDAGFKESIIDEMRAQKDEELDIIMRDVQLRGKFQTIEH